MNILFSSAILSLGFDFVIDTFSEAVIALYMVDIIFWLG